MSSRGSQWRRWDPHLHAPGTLLANSFRRTWDGYLEALEAADPPVSVLGVTDYFCIRTYKRACEFKAKGRMAGVDLLFPNVELRLDLKTGKVRPVNIHLLFSPEDPEHVREIERVLGRLECEFRDRSWRCTPEDLIQVGRIIDPGQTDDEIALSAGANQFKVMLSQIKDLFRRDEWVRRNCLVAVAGGLHDGTSGLQRDDSFALMRREIEGFADIMFAATPSQREFWLGKRPGHGPDVIERTYRFLKPCLHGSDAHVEDSVATPDLQRYCWIKGDPTFETLRQTVLEPEERVWIGPPPPPHHLPQMAVDALRVADAPWLGAAEIEFNSGLVAVIGARGSGKTALVEILARGARAPDAGKGESSFLRRAHEPVDLLGEAAAELSWRDGSTKSELLGSPEFDLEPCDVGDVCYLSQQFVDRLCSSAGLARELRAEMERVIFEATDPTERLDTRSFEELTDVLLEPIRRRRENLRDEVRSSTQQIVGEEQLHAKLSHFTKDRDASLKKSEQAKRDLGSLLPKGKEERAKHLGALEQAHAKVQSQIEGLKRRRQALVELAGEVQQIRSTSEPRRLADMRRRYTAAELSEEPWKAFAMDFVRDVDKVLETARADVERAIRVATEGDPATPVDLSKELPEKWPLNVLRERREAVRKEVGIDGERQKKSGSSGFRVGR